MSHEVHYGIYDENVDKKEVQAYWDDYAMHEDWQEGCSGLANKIRWIDHICDTKEEAELYIEQHDKGWYDQLAVKFRDDSEIPKNSALKDKLVKQIESYRAKKEVYDKAHSIANQKASFISCPCCKSKLSKEYLVSNRRRFRLENCPVCNLNDIRAEYVLKQLKAFQDRIDKWQKELKEEERRLAKKVACKAKVKWMVKIEYHT